MKMSPQNSLHRVAATSLWLLTTMGVAFGGGGAPIPVTLLIKNSDAIVIARILNGTINGETATVNLDVEQVWKGAVHAGNVLTVDYRLNPDTARYTTSIAKDRGLFFLKSENGMWSIAPVATGDIPEFRGGFFVLPTNPASGTRYPTPPQASLHERILAEVANSLESGEGQRGSGYVVFDWEYRSDPSPAMKALFAQFKLSKNPVLRDAGLRAAVASGDDQVLAQIGRASMAQNAGEMASIGEEIQYYLTSTDPRVVAQLGRIAVSETSPAVLRKACVMALARSHTKESLKYLATFLDNPDAELRSFAVGGLAMFANNVPLGQHGPASGDWKYRTDETLRNSAMDAKIIESTPGIVAFWKSWWAEHRAELQ